MSLESRPRPGPPAPSDPSGERRIFGDGGFAPLEALLRRVAGVSWLYWCNSPRLVVVSLESRPRPGPPAPSDPSGERRIFDDGGFCTTRSLTTACRRRVVALLVQFPLFGGGEVEVRGGEVAVRGGVAPKPQTTSVKNIDDGVLWLRWSAIWAQRRLVRCVVRTRTRYCVRSPAISHVNPLFRVWAGLPTLTLAGPGADQRAHVRMSGPRRAARNAGS